MIALFLQRFEKFSIFQYCRMRIFWIQYEYIRNLFSLGIDDLSLINLSSVSFLNLIGCYLALLLFFLAIYIHEYRKSRHLNICLWIYISQKTRSPTNFNIKMALVIIYFLLYLTDLFKIFLGNISKFIHCLLTILLLYMNSNSNNWKYWFFWFVVQFSR